MMAGERTPCAVSPVIDDPLDLLQWRGVDRAVRELVRQWVAVLPR